MTDIRIERLTDSCDCETCGVSYAEGAKVFFDGALALSLEPHAHCLGGNNFDDEDIYRRVFEALGHKLEVVHG